LVITYSTNFCLKRDKTERRVYYDLIISQSIPREDYELKNEEKNPRRINDELVELGGFQINVKSCIYSTASVNDILNGWKLLENSLQSDKLDRLFSLFFVRDIQEMNNYYYSNLLQGNEYCKFPIYEPSITILLRLSYWYNVCNKIVGFEKKKKDVHDKLRFSRIINDLIMKYGIKCTKVKDRMRQVNTTLYELFIASLAHLHDQNISFKKEHEFLINDVIIEVKTIHPELENYIQIEKIDKDVDINKINKVLIDFINKPEIRINHLNKAIEKQRSQIVFLVITFSYETNLLENLSDLEDKGEDFTFKKALEEAFKLKNNKEIIPLIIVTTAMGFNYQIFSIMLPLIKGIGEYKILHIV
jgi:hypothetical protein